MSAVPLVLLALVQAPVTPSKVVVVPSELTLTVAASRQLRARISGRTGGSHRDVASGVRNRALLRPQRPNRTHPTRPDGGEEAGQGGHPAEHDGHAAEGERIHRGHAEELARDELTHP